MWTTEVAYSTNWQKELLCKRCQQHCQNSNAKLERQQQCLYTYACYPDVPVNRQEKEADLLAHYCIIDNRKQNTSSQRFTPEDRRIGLPAKNYMHAQACTSIHKHTKQTALEFSFNKQSQSLLTLSATLLPSVHL